MKMMFQQIINKININYQRIFKLDWIYFDNLNKFNLL